MGLILTRTGGVTERFQYPNRTQKRDMTQDLKNAAGWTRFKELLDSQNDWPAEYPFKFIVPRAGLIHLEEIFPDDDLTIKESRRGNYLSVSVKIEAESSDSIVKIYESAAGIEGVISL